MARRRWIRAKRDRWLEDRKLVGKTRPLPLDVGEANCGSAGPLRTAQEVANSVRLAAKHADLIFYTEVFKVRVVDVLDDREWHVVQYGNTTNDQEKAGCAIALRKTRGRLDDPELAFGSEAFGDVRDRYIPHALGLIDGPDATGGWTHTWAQRVGAFHGPPLRAIVRSAAFFRRLRALNLGVAGGDGNRLAVWVGAALSRRLRWNHITGIAHRWWIPSSPPKTFGIQSDHRMTVTTLWP